MHYRLKYCMNERKSAIVWKCWILLFQNKCLIWSIKMVFVCGEGGAEKWRFIHKSSTCFFNWALKKRNQNFTMWYLRLISRAAKIRSQHSPSPRVLMKCLIPAVAAAALTELTQRKQGQHCPSPFLGRFNPWWEQSLFLLPTSTLIRSHNFG